VNYGWLSISPSLVSTIRLLTEDGYFIDVVYLYDEQFGLFEPESDRVNAVAIRNFKNKYLRKCFSLLQLLVSAFRIAGWQKYRFFVGVDQGGVITAGILSKVKKTPYIYYSLEMLTRESIDKTKTAKRLFLRCKKFLETYFSRRADRIIIQDKYRAGFLTEDNMLDKKKILIVPNSFYFLAKDNIDYGISYLQIPLDKKIVICTGTVSPITQIDEIVKSINLWHSDAVFLIHTSYITIYLDEIRQYIEQNKLEHKIFISTKRLNFGEVSSLIRKADIGIALYKSVDMNRHLCPSGKVSFYLAMGIPIIVNDIPILRDFVDEYKCGMYVKTPKEIGEAIRIILNDYSSFCVNASRCYNQELNFPKHFKKVTEYIRGFSQICE